MKKFIRPFLFAFLFMICGCAQDEKTEASLVSLTGDVKILPARERPARAGDLLRRGDLVFTGPSSSAVLLFDKTGIVRIAENTSVRISVITGKAVSLDMTRGRAFVSLLKIRKSFSVRTATSVAAVRGTSFLVSAGRDGSRVEVLQGKVLVTPVRSGKSEESAAVVVEVGLSVTVRDTDAFSGSKRPEVVGLRPAEIEEIRKDIRELRAELTEKLEKNFRELADRDYPDAKSAAKKAGLPVAQARKSVADQDKVMEEKETEAEKIDSEERKKQRQLELLRQIVNIPTL